MYQQLRYQATHYSIHGLKLKNVINVCQCIAVISSKLKTGIKKFRNVGYDKYTNNTNNTKG